MDIVTALRNGIGLLITNLLQVNPVPYTERKVLEWFGGVKGFMAYHQQPIYLKEYPDFE